MSRQRPLTLVVLSLWASCALCPQARAIELRSDLSLLGQVRKGDQSREQEAPTDLYGDMGAAGLPYRSSADTYFRVERDFGLDAWSTDFYAGYARVAGAVPGVDFTAGRQFLTEAPGGVFVADAGKVRIDPGWPVAFTLFGGQPRYFEPTFSSERISQDEVLFGGNLRTTRWTTGSLSLGYLQHERDQRVLRQLVSATGARAFTDLPGLPNVYGSVAYDADQQNLDLATAGVNVFLSQPRLLFNCEGTYYKPRDEGKRPVTNLNWQEDATFDLFSISRMLQLRGGLTYTLSRALSAYGDYSFQRYEKLAGIFENGHVGSVGLRWLPGGDGLEQVRLEYYVIDSSGGNVNGATAYYESRVYDRILFETKVDVTSYEKENNQHSTPVSGVLGLGYSFTPALTGELVFEANHNKRFDEEFRFGFLISYNFRHQSGESQRPRGAPREGRTPGEPAARRRASLGQASEGHAS